MKKVYSFVMVVSVLAVLLTVNVGSAGATPAPPPPSIPAVWLQSPYFEGLTPGAQVQAQMFVDSNFVNIYCVARNEGVVCKAPKKYAGQSVVLYLQVDGSTLLFYVRLPNPRIAPLPSAS